MNEDHRDAFVWHAKFTEYDEDGNVSVQFTEYDNDDELAFFYVDNVLQTRVDIDGDGSNTWEAKLTNFQSGEAVVTTYDSVEELPGPYAGMFGDGLLDVWY